MVILTYHSINDSASFERQIRHLKEGGYNMLSLADFCNGVRDHRRFKKKDILVTFDDGDCSVLENALPVLEKYTCPATLFVITSLIGTTEPFWWDEIMHFTHEYGQVIKAKRVPNEERLSMIANLRERGDRIQGRQLSWEQLAAMEKRGIDIANHSHTHPMFSQLTFGEIGEELRNSMALLRRHGFRHADVFAYPNGSASREAELALRKEDVRLAFLFDHRVCDRIKNPLRISRVSVNDRTPLWKFRLILSGIHSRIVPFTKRLGGFMHGR